MPKVRFQKGRDEILLNPGANLMETLLQSGVPVASSCKGQAVCGRCWVWIRAGMENLSAPGPDELRIQSHLDLPQDARVSCQVLVHGDITVDAPYW